MLLSSIQSQCLSVLQSAPYLQAAGISVYAVDSASAAALYANALGQIGVTVAILPPTGSFAENSDGPAASDGGLSTLVQLSEPVEAARAQGTPPLTDLAEACAWYLHSQNWPERGDAVPLGLRSLRLVPDKELLVYQLELVATGALSDPSPETAPDS